MKIGWFVDEPVYTLGSGTYFRGKPTVSLGKYEIPSGVVVVP